MERPKVVVILGSTASGKSALGVRLAQKFDGEVISADSRQVYRGLDIGAGKITAAEMRGVPHHMLDVADPRDVFTAADYQKLARQKIDDIVARGKLPIIVGGSAFYIKAVVDGVSIPSVPPNPTLRAELESLATEVLWTKLQALDPTRAARIDRHNRRRLVRALEVASTLGQVPPPAPQPLPYDVCMIGLQLPSDQLRAKIKKRLAARLKAGLIEEVEQLHARGLSWQRLDELGLEYRFVARYLQNEPSNDRAASEPVSKRVKRERLAWLVEKLTTAIWQFSRRQLTWWRRDARIYWIEGGTGAVGVATRLVRNFIQPTSKKSRVEMPAEIKQ